MKNIEMTVVISHDDEERFTKYRLDIKKHRTRINLIDGNGHNMKNNFKDPTNALSLVIICAMWLTGFYKVI